MPACPQCQAENSSTAVFCGSCGFRMSGTPPAAAHEKGSEAVCLVLGLCFLAIGLWYLVVSPGLGSALLGQDVVNLQKLTIGETSSIMGAIFLAAAARPRRG